MNRPGQAAGRILVVVAKATAVAVLIALVLVSVRFVVDEPVDEAATASTPFTSPTEAIELGRYLALAGNCAGCHSRPGAPAYAGGAGLATPFGTLYPGNLTPDADTGLGRWSAEDFRRAMHSGRSRDGRLLYPAFPYGNFTLLTRRDTDALYAFLQDLPAVPQANPPHRLRFPYNTQAALAVWRALYFRPGGAATDPRRSEQWNRGAYLVRALGHCNACHAPRGWLGAVNDSPELRGGLMSERHWFAPALGPADGADAADARARWIALLRDGIDGRHTMSGPMADVVFQSTQHLHDADLRAIALFLGGLPPRPGHPPALPPRIDSAQFEIGHKIYDEHCADCHGKNGEGVAEAYPALDANPAVTADPPANLVRIVLEGGFAPATRGNPRPHGMPPFAPRLSSTQIAAVLSYLRTAWSNRAAALSTIDAERYR